LALLAGIDEAGYGPLLGPLVVSSAVFEVPDELLKEDMWKLLKKSVSKEKKRCKGRIVIADSKKVYSPATGVGQLQRSILTCLKVLGKTPITVRHLAETLDPEVGPRLDAYPWFADIDRLIDDVPRDLGITSSVFAKDLAAKGLRLASLRSICFDVAHYNKLVAATNNKSTVSFGAVIRLIIEATKVAAGQTVQVVVDRQSGRNDYVTPLRLHFPEAELTVVRQDEEIGSYELKFARGTLRVHFVVGGDDRSLPTALASMASKYLREILMASHNRYFTALCPELRPTAGYWKDGTRFLDDLKVLAPQIRYDPQMLIRDR
jgi:ribonuclease HII